LLLLTVFYLIAGIGLWMFYEILRKQRKVSTVSKMKVPHSAVSLNMRGDPRVKRKTYDR
jgi:hypothetical protein